MSVAIGGFWIGNRIYWTLSDPWLQVIYSHLRLRLGARGSIVGWGIMLQAGKWRVGIQMPLDFLNLPNSSIRIMALELTQPLTEMSTKNLPGV
jgi:hypothetical protein